MGKLMKREGRPGKRSVIAAACAVLAVGCLLYGGYRMVKAGVEANQSEKQMEELREQSRLTQTLDELSQPIPGPPTLETVSGEAGETEEPGESAEPEPAREPNPYAEQFSQNEDMAAWLLVDGTKIDYPVMYTPEDENYYLNRDFYGNEDQAGCLILDTDSRLYEDETTNLIIHGHHMKAGTMFGDLDLYQKEDYFKEHRFVKLFTRECEKNYEVIAAFYSQVFLNTDIVFKYYNFFQADTSDEFHYFYDNIKELALYDTGVTAEFGDHFLTLSTCAYHVEDGRFVVVAKELEPGPEYEPIAGAAHESAAGAEDESAAGAAHESEAGAEDESAAGAAHESAAGAEDESAAGAAHESEAGAEDESAAGAAHESEAGSVDEGIGECLLVTGGKKRKENAGCCIWSRF